MIFMSKKDKIKKEKLRDRIRKKYRVVVYNNETYEEKIHFKFTLLNFFNIVVFSSILLIVLVTYLIAFTPLREYIPGYTDVSLNRRVYEMERRAHDEAIASDRRSQVGSGDRSQRIRTYNFPQGRVTDHRIGLTLHKIDAIIDGDLDEIMDALATTDQMAKMQEGNVAE